MFESDRFDFKEMLPLKKAEPDKIGLKKLCAAFANSDGGFLIFGVKDNKDLSAADRIVGLDPAQDFPVQFGNYPGASEPSLSGAWSFRNPPIMLGNGRVVHVVHVPPSPRRPHGVLEEQRWWFCKRTNKGTEVMSHEEIRMSFQDLETRRSKLALISSELGHMRFLAQRLLEKVPENASTDALVIDTAWTTRYPTSVLDLLLGDAFSLVTRKLDLWAALSALRVEVRQSNARAEAYSHYEFIRSTKDPQQRKKLYETMRLSAQSIDGYAEQSKELVDAALMAVG